RRHPEFLYRGAYASHWSEPTLRDARSDLKPDFVLKPLTMLENAWNWEILDLKRHNAEIATAHRNHPDLSAAVYHGCAQLRNYRRFFDDPRNRDRLMQQFGGVVPQPKLALIIGRITTQNADRIGRLRNAVPDVEILTYDEILSFRRTQVQRERWR